METVAVFVSSMVTSGGDVVCTGALEVLGEVAKPPFVVRQGCRGVVARVKTLFDELVQGLLSLSVRFEGSVVPPGVSRGPRGGSTGTSRGGDVEFVALFCSQVLVIV